MSKTRFRIMPEAIYILKLEDFNGNEFEIEELGQNIINQLRRSYALDKLLEEEWFDVTHGEAED